jgi:alkylation response protein AidB-like acyl-CoA dehydrogenase
MTSLRPRDLLTEPLLAELAAAADPDPAGTSGLTGSIARLAEVGYLAVALPPEFGGLGCTLRQAACGQRRLTRSAPRTALAVSAHLYWTGAAADAYRAGDESARWILPEAARGALFAGGHAGTDGGDLRFADPRSRCAPAEGGYQFADPGAVATVTPAWDWIAVHGVHQAPARPGHRAPCPQTVVAFAGRGTGASPAFRVARAAPAGTPADTFLASALTWGHSILASVQYADTKRAFDAALTAYAESAAAALTSAAGIAIPRPADRRAAPADPDAPPAGYWPAAEAGARLAAMKARIADVTHPWHQMTQASAPDLGGQHLIGLYAMRHEIAEGAASVHDVITQLTGTPAPARPLVR